MYMCVENIIFSPCLFERQIAHSMFFWFLDEIQVSFKASIN